MSEPRVIDVAGWGFPQSSRKAHYFEAGSSFSLCERWGFYFGPRETDTGAASKDDCTPCRRKFERAHPAPSLPGEQPGGQDGRYAQADVAELHRSQIRGDEGHSWVEFTDGWHWCSCLSNYQHPPTQPGGQR